MTIKKITSSDYLIKTAFNGTSITLDSPSINIIGNLSVTGNVTSVSTTNLTVKDNIIVLNKGETSAGVLANTSGIEIDRGTLLPVDLRWDESIGNWQLTKDGTFYANILSHNSPTPPLFHLIEDTAPTIGGNLNVNGFDIWSSSGNVNFNSNVTIPSTALLNNVVVNTASISNEIVSNAHIIAANIDTEYVAQSHITTANIASSTIDDLITSTANIANLTSALSTISNALIEQSTITTANIAVANVGNLYSYYSTLNVAHTMDAYIVDLHAITGNIINLVSNTFVADNATIKSALTIGPTANVTPGVSLNINTTDSIILPVGTTNQRPSNIGYTDITGMIRFNNTIEEVEYYNGTKWKTAGIPTFTLATDEQFVADGLTTTYTLSSNLVSTNNAIVSINGQVQAPITAYTVVGNLLTFVSPPLATDIIDVRGLSITTVMIPAPNADWNAISGPSYVFNKPVLANVAISGDYNDLTNTPTTFPIISANVTTSTTTIDSFQTTLYGTAKYIVYFKATTGEVMSSEVLVAHNGSTAEVVTYGILLVPGTTIANISASLIGTTILVQLTTSLTGVVKVTPAYIPV